MSSLATLSDAVRYAAAEIRRNGASRTWWKNRFLHRVVGDVWFRRVRGNDGEYVMARDWDNLLLLDACRLDLYRQVANPDADAIRSRGSATPEWVRENFVGRSFPDTVYVTANPYVSIITDDEFHARYDVWDDAWDDEAETVRPDTLAERTRAIAADHPDKRLIVHFMQPHQPFVDSDLPGSFWNVDESPWTAMQDDGVDASAILRAYADNLRLAYPVARELGMDLPGKSVITADHGNMLGERVRPFPIREYGHRESLYTPANVEVPWDELPFETRKPIVAGDAPAATHDQDTEGRGQAETAAEHGDGTAAEGRPAAGKREITADVTDRLADLGYVDR